MKKVLQTVACLAIAMSLAGCVLSGGKIITTTKSIDPATGKEKVVMTEKDADFWESGNLRMYYEADGKRVDGHTAVSMKKVDGLLELERSRTYSTPTEATLGGVITSLLVAQVRESAPPPSSVSPKTAVDMFERNLIPLAYLGVGIASEIFDLDIGGPFGGAGEGNTALDNVIAGGDIYVNSERSDQYYLEEGSAWGGQENPSFSWHYETNTGNSTNSGQEGAASSNVPTDDNTSLF